jgi:hypothetical protein
MTRRHNIIAKIVPPLALAMAFSYFGPIMSAFQLAPTAVEYKTANSSEFFKNMPDPQIIRQ